MNFLPKPAEGAAGNRAHPWYHRNVDYDEIAFFHGGSLYGIPMPPGLISRMRRKEFTTAHRRRPANGHAASSDEHVRESIGKSSPSTPDDG